MVATHRSTRWSTFPKLVQAVGTNTPPGSPTSGQAWIVGSAPTGAWLSTTIPHATHIALWRGNDWAFNIPAAGWRVRDVATLLDYTFDGTAWVAGNSGTYTPTFTAGTNVSAGSATVAHYLRNGNAAVVFGKLSATPSGTGVVCEATLTLPPACPSNMTLATDLHGNGHATDVNQGGGFYTVPANDLAVFRFFASVAGSQQYAYSYSYLIK